MKSPIVLSVLISSSPERSNIKFNITYLSEAPWKRVESNYICMLLLNTNRSAMALFMFIVTFMFIVHITPLKSQNGLVKTHLSAEK